MPAIAVFFNPLAGKNRYRPADRARRLQLALGRTGTLYVTRSLAELAVTVRAALAVGTSVFVADGGDGSLHCLLNEVRQALAEVGRDPDELPPLLPTSSGSIDFVARKVENRGDPAAALRRLARFARAGQAPPVVTVPSLRVSGERHTDDENAPFERIGFALAAGGIGQRFFAKYRDQRAGSGAIVRVAGGAVFSFLLARTGAGGLVPASWLAYGDEVFRPTRARVTIDGRSVGSELHGAIHAGAFHLSLGGVFGVFPLARPGESIHFQAGSITPSGMIRSLPRLVRGEPLDDPALVEVAGAEMRVEYLEATTQPPILDGEDLPHPSHLVVRRGPPVRIVDLSGAAQP